MKNGFVAMFFILLLSCEDTPKEKLQHLNGYWEIVEVRSKEGFSKAYQYNTTIDYIYINDLEGFRKKMQPGINKAYKTSNDMEAIKVKIENDSLNLYYTTDLATWKETVLKADEKELEIINTDEIVYVYRRYEPIELNLDE
jgi:hypothetical protein